VIFAASSQQVTDTWVAGRRLLADSRLTLLDESAALDRAEAWRARLDADAGRETIADD
jgi:5-methylthioadenosine/S-adenosylhomocysteine deaminase